MRNYFAAIALLLLFTTFTAAQTRTATPDEDDNQIWHETVIGLPLTKKLTVNLNGVLRFSGDQRRLVDNRAGAGLSFKANKNVTIGTSYLYRVTEAVRNRKNYENRFIAYLTLAKTFGKFGVSDRTQFEYQARNSRTDKQVYRNRLQVEREVKVNKFAFKPFASAEIFYDSQFKALSRLRLIGGASRKLYKNLTLDAYYLRQQDGRTRPGDLNVFGTTLRFNFDFFGISN